MNPKTLVICIDRDDDVGIKAKVKTPVIGKEKNKEVAFRLGSVDPNNSDLNAIFAAIKVYDELISSGRDAEIILVSGDEQIGIKSDEKIAQQLDEVISKINAKGSIVVTDGSEDEFVLPIIQSRVKVNSVNRVVVSQSQNLETSYYKVKRMLEDPRMAKNIFAPLGVILIIFAIFTSLGHPEGAFVPIFAILGIYMILKGVGLDYELKDLWESAKTSFFSGKMTFITYISATLVTIIATIVGITRAWDLYLSNGSNFMIILATFVSESVWWYVGASSLIILGKMLDNFLEYGRVWQHWVLVFFLFAAGLILWGGSTCLILVANESIGMGVQYLLFSIIGSVIVSLMGVGISSFTRKKLVLNEDNQ